MRRAWWLRKAWLDTKRHRSARKAEPQVRIVLPYPPKHCWPNSRSRSHWPKTNAKAKARGWAYGITKNVAPRCFSHNGQSIPVSVICHPKAKGPHPDGDNVQAACKAYFDGIAEVLGVNDQAFVIAPTVFADRHPQGQIVIVIGGAA